MPTRHVVHQIDAYLAHQLSAEDHAVVEAHVALCSTCARHLLEARRVAAELGPMMQTRSKPQGRDPVLTDKDRREVFSYISEIYTRKDKTKMPGIVLIGGLNPSNLENVVDRDFQSQYGFFPVIAVIGSAIHADTLINLIKTTDELKKN